MSLPSWPAYDEGYLRAHEWARALAGGTRMPQVAATTRLGPGEVAHARIGPVSVAAYFGEDVDYRPSLFLVGGPVGLAVTGAASIARNQAKKAEAQQAATPRWHKLGTAEVQVTNQRMAVTGNGRKGSFWYAELSPLQLVVGKSGVPGVQFQPDDQPVVLLQSAWAPMLYVFVHHAVDARPPALPMPAGLLERAKAQGRLR